MFSFQFFETFKNNFLKDTRYGCFWLEYKCNNTKIIQMNIKHNYILPISSSLTSNCCSSFLLKTTFRSSLSQMFFKIAVYKNSAIFTVKHLCWNNFIKKRLQLRVFPMNIAKFLRTAFFMEHLQWLFLDIFIIF